MSCEDECDGQVLHQIAKGISKRTVGGSEVRARFAGRESAEEGARALSKLAGAW